MKKIILFAILVVLVTVVLGLFGQEFTYVGADKCQFCHKTEKQGRQYPIWQASRHASSFAALSSPQAADTAQRAGVKDPSNDPKCLQCHAPLFAKAPELKAEGVTCEVCHGPGSEYRKLSVMKDLALAKKSGLILPAGIDEVKNACLTCHADAHGMTFDFAAAWTKIKHMIPKS